jgi:hypothetical protein
MIVPRLHLLICVALCGCVCPKTPPLVRYSMAQSKAVAQVSRTLAPLRPLFVNRRILRVRYDAMLMGQVQRASVAFVPVELDGGDNLTGERPCGAFVSSSTLYLEGVEAPLWPGPYLIVRTRDIVGHTSRTSFVGPSGNTVLQVDGVVRLYPFRTRSADSLFAAEVSVQAEGNREGSFVVEFVAP